MWHGGSEGEGGNARVRRGPRTVLDSSARRRFCMCALRRQRPRLGFMADWKGREEVEVVFGNVYRGFSWHLLRVSLLVWIWFFESLG